MRRRCGLKAGSVYLDLQAVVRSAGSAEFAEVLVSYKETWGVSGEVWHSVRAWLGGIGQEAWIPEDLDTGGELGGNLGNRTAHEGLGQER